MDSLNNINVEATANTAMISDRLAYEIEESAKFEKVLARLDAEMESSEDRAYRLEKEAEAAQARKEKNKKINELQGLISQLRSKISSSGGDPRLEAQLSAVQNELFWLMFSL